MTAIRKTPIIQQFSNGSGDHTTEKQQQPEKDSASVALRAATLKAKGLLQPPSSAKVIE